MIIWRINTYTVVSITVNLLIFMNVCTLDENRNHRYIVVQSSQTIILGTRDVLMLSQSNHLIAVRTDGATDEVSNELSSFTGVPDITA